MAAQQDRSALCSICSAIELATHCQLMALFLRNSLYA
jgi:hypothetical protein